MKLRVNNHEHPSTVIVKVVRDRGRYYWTGSGWNTNLDKARQYTRAEAERRAGKKSGDAFVITLGFPPNF